MVCHAATDLEAALPGFIPPEDTGTVASRKGDDIHKVLASALSVGNNTDLKDIISMLNYVAFVRDQRKFSMLIEHRMLTLWMQKPVLTTADVILYTRDELHIIDHKSGSGLVDPQCRQMFTYAAAALYEGLAPKATEVVLHINQPRANNQTSYSVSREDLMAFIELQKYHEKQLLAGDLTFTPMHAACLFCPANPNGRGAKGSGTMCAAAVKPRPIWTNGEQDSGYAAQPYDDSLPTMPQAKDDL